MSNTFKQIKAMEGFGRPIPNSRFYRSFCGRCLEPMRVDETHLSVMVYCEYCNPPHRGCSSPIRPSASEDYDSYGGGAVSLQHDYGDNIGQ